MKTFGEYAMASLPFMYILVGLAAAVGVVFHLPLFPFDLPKAGEHAAAKRVKTRVVVMAANRYSNGTMLVGLRHWDANMAAQWEALSAAGLLPNEPDPEQGFLDNRGRFLTRRRAWIVAERAGQIIRTPGDKVGYLYSENLY